jgi:AAA+ superfamily predicted ATPase
LYSSILPVSLPSRRDDGCEEPSCSSTTWTSLRRRGQGADALTDEIVGQLPQELDGIQSRHSEVFLLAATNHIDQIDPAVLSRFQERITIPFPDFEARERLLTVLLQKKQLACGRRCAHACCHERRKGAGARHCREPSQREARSTSP